MKIRVFCFLALLLSGCNQEKEQEWKIVWSDEFDYAGLPDPSKWGYEAGFIRNNELQYYTDTRPENAVVKDGTLLLIGKEEQYESASYTSASITTDRKHSWTYGKIDARMKLPKGQGIWPAFWMLGQNIHEVGWPACGEIDIMEHINNEDILYGTLHWHNQKHVSDGSKTNCEVSKYHNYTIEWDKEAVKWFLDGVQYHEVNVKDSINSTAELHKPFYIILNLAIGGNWPKNPDETTRFPDSVFVDYVRVYQKSKN